jgi:hypothetical protein
MAEPQRASSASDVASRPKPRPRHPSSYAPPPRLPVDETENLNPPGQMSPSSPHLPVDESVERPERGGKARRPVILWMPSRSPGEWALMGIVLLGLALNVSVLVTATLSPTDRALGLAVFLAGVVLLVLMVLCRGGNYR